MQLKTQLKHDLLVRSELIRKNSAVWLSMAFADVEALDLCIDRVV